MNQTPKSRFFSYLTLKQLIGYGLVSLAEYFAGLGSMFLLIDYGLLSWAVAFTVSQAFIGFGAFVVRKKVIFKA